MCEGRVLCRFPQLLVSEYPRVLMQAAAAAVNDSFLRAPQLFRRRE